MIDMNFEEDVDKILGAIAHDALDNVLCQLSEAHSTEIINKLGA